MSRMSEAARKNGPRPEDITVGATLTEVGQWVGWVYDGKKRMDLPARGSRDIALSDARNHKDRLLHPPLPKKIWRPK